MTQPEKGARYIKLELKDGESIAFCGDLHADSVGPESRIDSFLDTVVSKLNDVFVKCVAKHVKCVFFSGDIFSRISVPHECVSALGAVLRQFVTENIALYTVVGNHDIARNQMDKLKKSPLQTLISLGIIETLGQNIWVIINKRTLITSVNYTEYPIPATPKAKHNILLAHMFYKASELFDSTGAHSISEQNVLDWGYDAMFLGHDHVWYPITHYGKTDIVRPGSIMRATFHDYNRERMPCFYILKNPSEYSSGNWEEVFIKALPFDDVASSSSINKKNLKNLNNLQDIMSDLADRLASTSSEGTDRIVELIKTDKNISDEVRFLILQYLTEFGISV